MKIRRLSDRPHKVVVIGAGVGGLSAAAALARRGVDVTVLEAHVYPGGCAGTFYHQGFRFDAGATLAGGFYPGGPMDILARNAGIKAWDARPSELAPASGPAPLSGPAMRVHLPGGLQVDRYGDERRWDEYRLAFGEASLPFWRWQERTSDAMWALALRSPDWPPQTPAQVATLASRGFDWLAKDVSPANVPSLLRDALRPVAGRLPSAPDSLRQFVDAQLLISAQTTSRSANALYAAAALDLPRRGVVHLAGGIGAIAQALAQAIRDHGGRVLYRQEVTRIITRDGQPVAVQTKRGETFEADIVIANLTPWNLQKLLETTPAALRLNRRPFPSAAWGAFVIYLGVDGALLPRGSALHHQVVAGEPLGEGNSVFLSISPEWDRGRAPAGRRAITLSTHTRLEPWWQLHAEDKPAYEQLKQLYVEKMLANAEIALPGIRDAAVLTLPGTPVTFNTFTRRHLGWVGGFPQTSLLRAAGPRLTPQLWMVGDSIFPGQSTAAVALGGLRVAAGVLRELHGVALLDEQPLPAVGAITSRAGEA